MDVVVRYAIVLAVILGAGCGSSEIRGSFVPAPSRPPLKCDNPSDRTHLAYVTVNGSDEGAGTLESPWATITHAVANVADDTTILVGPGTYTGRIELDAQFDIGVTIRAEPAYHARLRNDGTVVTIFRGQGITLNGFDIAHSGSGADALVVQIQDLIGEPGGEEAVSRITLQNNILHDSYSNDILKINNGARDVTVERNVFYNQEGSDEHIDVNSVADVLIQDNLFFNDFAASGRENNNDTSSYIVIKDSNEDDDSYLGSERVFVRRNVFFHWQGSPGSNFVLVGEDGQSYHEAVGVVVENNLLMGTTQNPMRAPFGVKGGRDIAFRHNTVLGEFPDSAFSVRLNVEGDNPPNENILLLNNVWDNPFGTMDNFSDTPRGESVDVSLDHNLYWNGGQPLPEDSDDLLNPIDDVASLEKDPLLTAPRNLVPPTWDAESERFADGSKTICEAFATVARFAIPDSGSPVLGAALAEESPSDDLLGNPRSGATSLGAVELQ